MPLPRQTVLKFTYTVQAGDVDVNGISIAAKCPHLRGPPRQSLH